MKILLAVLVLAASVRGETAAELGERYWRTKSEADRHAWVTALDREGHDFGKRYKPDYGPRGIYKFNRESKLACFVITKKIAETLGKDAFDAETADGPVHFEWTRQADGSVWLGTFDSNFPNGHTDFPPHFHIIPGCRDGQQVRHFYVRVAGGRPCDAVNVEVPEGGSWKTVRTITVTDDPYAGVMETPEGTVRYDPASGKLTDDRGGV